MRSSCRKGASGVRMPGNRIHSAKQMGEYKQGQQIEVLGARVHNLKDIDVVIPRNQLTVITGLSGSGKSSLAFDTIYAEGQRRYIETLSAYARQFLGSMERPDVDKITGLSPVISIEQKTTSRNPTLRLLFVDIALRLRNVCVWVHWVYLATPRRGGRKLNLHRLRFKTLLMWLTHLAEETFGFDDTAVAERAPQR